MPSKRIWYVYSDAHTNEVIAESQLTHVLHKEVLCIDGVKRDLWEIDEELIKTLKKNRAESQLDFEIFYRESKGSPVRHQRRSAPKMTIASSKKMGLVRSIRA